MKSHWKKWLSEPGNLRLVAIEGTALMHELALQQGLKGEAQKGYADSVLGALLIASAHKSNESININAQGSGVYKQSIVDASPEGRVRGFLIEEKNQEMHTYGPEGKNGPWGTGILSVLYTKNFEGKYPYRGVVPISSGYFDEALNEYYRDSEQLASKVGLFVEHDGHQIRSARGALVQALGGATEEEQLLVKSLSLAHMRALAKLANQSDLFISEAGKVLAGREFREVESQNLSSFCNCSQERIERALVLSGEADIIDALGDDPYMTVVCDFCRTEYKLAAERVRALFSQDPSRLQ